MVAHEDYEVVFLGEVVSQRLDDYLSRLEVLGYDREVAEAGICAFRRHLMDETDSERDLPMLDHVKDVVELMPAFCRQATATAA